MPGEKRDYEGLELEDHLVESRSQDEPWRSMNGAKRAYVLRQNGPIGAEKEYGPLVLGGGQTGRKRQAATCATVMRNGETTEREGTAISLPIASGATFTVASQPYYVRKRDSCSTFQALSRLCSEISSGFLVLYGFDCSPYMPIILRNLKKTSETSDEAGTTIIKSTYAAAPSVRPPYEVITARGNISCVPSLVSYAVRAMYAYPEQMHVLGRTKLQYRPSSSLVYDLLRELIPWYDPENPEFSLKEVDPRLWATVVQIFSGLPDSFRTYHVPLSDQYMPLLQQIHSTCDFSLITILELPGCPEITDDSIIELKQVSSLCALDISGTRVTAHGIKHLAGTLVWDNLDDSFVGKKRGPWALRILDVRKCKDIDNEIFASVSKFILLTVLGMFPTATPNSDCLISVVTRHSGDEMYSI